MSENILYDVNQVLEFYSGQHIVPHDSIPADVILDPADYTLQGTSYIENGNRARTLLQEISKPIKERKEGFVHVYDWLDSQLYVAEQDSGLAHAIAFLDYKAMPAYRKMIYDNLPMFRDMKCFCTIKGVRHRVTGASSMGSVFVTKDLESRQYQIGVEVTECYDWGPIP